MAERGHVLEPVENAGRDPAGKSKYPARFLGNSGVSEERVEAQGAAASHTTFSIEREEEGVGEQRDVERTCGEAPRFDFIRHKIENLLVEKLVKKEDCSMAVAGCLGEISLHLRAESVHIHCGKPGHSNRQAVDDSGGTQVGVPAGFHLVEEFGALDSIAKLDAGSAGVIGGLKVGRVESGR